LFINQLFTLSILKKTISQLSSHAVILYWQGLVPTYHPTASFPDTRHIAWNPTMMADSARITIPFSDFTTRRNTPASDSQTITF